MAIGTALAVTSTLVSMYMSAKQGSQEAANAAYNQAVNEANSRVATLNANFEQDRKRKEGHRFVGTQQALYAKAGVRFEGSPVDMMMSTVKDIEMDIFAIELNKMAAISNAKSRGAILAAEKKYAKQSGWMNAVSTGVQGAASIYESD